MAFTRAIVLHETEAKELFWELVEEYRRDVGEELFEQNIEEVLEDLEVFLKSEFDKLLDDEDVDEMIIFVRKDAYEVWDGDEFLDVLAKKVFRERSVRDLLLGVIRDWGIEEE